MACGGGEAQLVTAYRRVAEERMCGLPIYNEALTVEAVGFRDWQGVRVGVLVTPWFMNLVLIPGTVESPGEGEPVGSGEYRLPSGGYEFQLCRFAGAGDHWSVPLFSNMHGFPDRDTARAVAEEVMLRVMADSAGARQATVDVAPLSENSGTATVSRRDLLRRWLLSDD